MLFFASLALSFIASALAAPAGTCSLSKAKLTVPTGLTAPTGAPKFVGLGVGTQNYTCSSTGSYASAGAVATLYDVSCLVNTPMFSRISDIAITVWEGTSSPAKVGANSRLGCTKVLGQHYFITNPITGSGISPKWDFGSKGFVVAAKVANVPAPTGAEDVDYLELSPVEGSLATKIYRVDTRAGQPPASCDVGSDPIQVKYTSMYWLF